jgi:lipopolysaccharide biosynthesis regulator YciM
MSDLSWEFWGSIAAASLLIVLLVAIVIRRRRGKAQAREQSAYREAVKALLADDLESASEALRTAAETNSSRVSTYLALGRLFRRMGDPERALQVHRAVTVRQGIPNALRLESLRESAADDLAADRPSEALSLLDEVLAKNRKDQQALETAAEAHLRLEHWEAAYEMHRRIDRITKQSRPVLLARLLAARGQQLLSAGDLSAARKVFKKALGIDGENVDVLIGQGDVNLAEAKAERAIECWEKILEKEPRWIEILTPRLEQAYYKLGDLDRLEELLRTLVSRRPGDAGIHLVLARHQAKKHRNDDALGALKQTLDLDPANIAARQVRGRILLDEPSGVNFETEYEELLGALPAEPSALRCRRCGAPSTEPSLRCHGCGAWDSVHLETSRSS